MANYNQKLVLGNGKYCQEPLNLYLFYCLRNPGDYPSFFPFKKARKMYLIAGGEKSTFQGVEMCAFSIIFSLKMSTLIKIFWLTNLVQL